MQRNRIWWKYEHHDYDPCLGTLTLGGFAELTTHVWWNKFVKEMCYWYKNCVIRIQSILSVCNNTVFKTRVKFLFPLSICQSFVCNFRWVFSNERIVIFVFHLWSLRSDKISRNFCPELKWKRWSSFFSSSSSVTFFFSGHASFVYLTRNCMINCRVSFLQQ